MARALLLSISMSVDLTCRGMTVSNHGLLQTGTRAPEFESGMRRLKLQIRMTPRARGKGAGSVATMGRAGVTGVPGAQHDQPQSTNVSSPLQQVRQRPRVSVRRPAGETTLRREGYANDGFVVSDDQASDGYSDESEGFEPVRQSRKHRDDSRSAVGRPITTDDTMDALDEIHQIVVEGFVRSAKFLGEEVGTQAELANCPS